VFESFVLEKLDFDRQSVSFELALAFRVGGKVDFLNHAAGLVQKFGGQWGEEAEGTPWVLWRSAD
jgi:hypothetical protein